MKDMTMRELAKLANVSLSTVSKAFSDAEDIHEETKQHVFNIAKEHGCFRQFYKGRFAKPVIAIILPELESADYNEYAVKLQQLIREAGGIALICSDDYEGSCQEELIDYYVSYINVDGMFVFELKSPLKKGYDIPMVSMFSTCRTDTDSIEVDDETYAREIVNYLSSLGHKRVAVIGEDFTAERAEAFQKVSADTDQSGYWFYYSKYRAKDAVADCVERILCAETRPTAIVCEYDYMAVGVIQYLNKKGYDVPKDFSVMARCYTNISRYTDYALTTADFNLDDVCGLAWDLMQKKLDNRYYSLNQRIVINCRLVIGETTAPPAE